MSPLVYARQRIHSVLSEIGRLQDSDFPYSHSRDALQRVEEVFNRRLTALEGLTDKNDPAVVRTACSESLLQIFRFLPLLGFILRSTNIRNSFEVFGPLLRLSRQILGNDTRLIVSSEWVYSPHVYNPISDLPDFVLLGLPASESGNPLLIPLAGHELGHTTWHKKGLANSFGKSVTATLNALVKLDEKKYKELFGGDLSDLFVSQNLAPAHFCAMRQIEESFCDFLGLKLFSESYLSAFAYLLMPGGGERSELYPSIKERVDNLIVACNKFGVTPPTGYADWFSSDSNPARNEKEQFLLKLADAARSSVIDRLINEADAIARSSNVPERSTSKIESIEQSFRLLVPVEGVGDLTCILNAAWRAFHDEGLWSDIEVDRISTLNELVLKSIEILEFESRTS